MYALFCKRSIYPVQFCYKISVCVSVCLSVCLSVYLSLSLSLSLSVSPPIALSLSLYICLCLVLSRSLPYSPFILLPCLFFFSPRSLFIVKRMIMKESCCRKDAFSIIKAGSRPISRDDISEGRFTGDNINLCRQT